jgi:hypothetical protein
MFCLMKTLEYTLNKGIFTLVGTTFNLLGKIFNVVVKKAYSYNLPIWSIYFAKPCFVFFTLNHSGFCFLYILEVFQCILSSVEPVDWELMLRLLLTAVINIQALLSLVISYIVWLDWDSIDALEPTRRNERRWNDFFHAFFLFLLVCHNWDNMP